MVDMVMPGAGLRDQRGDLTVIRLFEVAIPFANRLEQVGLERADDFIGFRTQL